jgi:hypothetical protein
MKTGMSPYAAYQSFQLELAWMEFENKKGDLA